MPREGRQGHPAESSTKPSLQSCNTWVQSSLAFALLCVMLQPELFYWCWTHPFPPLEQLWHLQPGFFSWPLQLGRICSHAALLIRGFLGLSMQWWTEGYTSHNAKSTKIIGVSISCALAGAAFPQSLPLLLFPVCLLWWILAPLVHPRLEIGEPWGGRGRIAEATLENTNDLMGEKETEPGLWWILGLFNHFLFKEKHFWVKFFAPLWILWWSQGIKSFSSLFLSL